MLKTWKIIRPASLRCTFLYQDEGCYIPFNTRDELIAWVKKAVNWTVKEITQDTVTVDTCYE